MDIHKIVGVVEHVEDENEQPFQNSDELVQILATQCTTMGERTEEKHAGRKKKWHEFIFMTSDSFLSGTYLRVEKCWSDKEMIEPFGEE